MTKIEKIIINQKRQEWRATKEAEFDTLFVGVKLDEDGEVEEAFSDAFSKWLSEMGQYEVITTDEDGVESTATYSRKVRPMPRFTATQADIDEWNKTIYVELRAKEYPPMEDYLDAVVKGDTVAQQAYIDACNAVKLTYPKA